MLSVNPGFNFSLDGASDSNDGVSRDSSSQEAFEAIMVVLSMEVRTRLLRSTRHGEAKPILSVLFCSLQTPNIGLHLSNFTFNIWVLSFQEDSSSLPSIYDPNWVTDLANGDNGVQLPAQQSEIVFMGTGTSEGIPRVSCLTNPSKKCPVCTKAVEPGNKNRRLNTSILIRYPGPSGRRNILIDAGKPFKMSVTSVEIIWLLLVQALHVGTCLIITSCISARIRTIDAVIITHSHADAIGGLDDLRDWTNNVQRHIPIYVAMRDFEVMKKTHYYLVDTSGIIPGAAVSELQFNIIDEEPFTVQDLKITPLPVWHGAGYRSLGFRFGNICYISDVSEIPEETYPFLKDCEILIMDALRPDRSSSTHFGLPRVDKFLAYSGMMHLMDHEKVNEELLKLMETEGLDVQLSYDGLRVPVML
ncbi:Lactamase B domain-containing protein [Citrus sinensis]|uniref:Lactamase B domain-containing protein n=1 Tax=Citrus sinensis TaxID=2711 RepID=A0ACB8J612_CITSI|nr:Lactamase B domain-containing protein [Citrus sinensis]